MENLAVCKHLTVFKKKKIPVCKKTFQNTFGLQTEALIVELGEKIKSGIVGQNVRENREKKMPQHKILVEIKEKITSHINSFKLCTPHYRRKMHQM